MDAQAAPDRLGITNSAYEFNGSSDNLTDLTLSPTGFTISAWGNVMGTENIQTIVNFTSTTQLQAFGINYTESSKEVGGYATPTSMNGFSPTKKNQWNHYVITTNLIETKFIGTVFW